MLQDTSIVTGRAYALSRWLGTSDLTAQPPGIPQPPPDFPPISADGPGLSETRTDGAEHSAAADGSASACSTPRGGAAASRGAGYSDAAGGACRRSDAGLEPAATDADCRVVALKTPRTSQLSVDFLRQMIRKENGLPAIAPPKASVIDMGKQ